MFVPVWLVIARSGGANLGAFDLWGCANSESGGFEARRDLKRGPLKGTDLR